MALTKTIQLSYAGGEISPDMYGRKDDTRYQNGLAKCMNFICLPQGPIRNRPGFEFVNECGIEDKPVRLIPFTYSAGQTMIVELGDKYAKFHSYGATLVNDDGTHYKIETPWAAEDIFDLVFVQSGDIVTFVSDKYPPAELRRYGARDWRIQTVQINTKLATPTNVKAERVTQASDDPNKDKYTMKYRVSCLNEDKTEESEASDIVEVVANLYSYGTTVKISCDEMPGAAFYRFYKNQGGLYGYIGDSETPEIIDDNITPKTDVTIRRFDDVFIAAGGIKSVNVIYGGSDYATAGEIVKVSSKGTNADSSSEISLPITIVPPIVSTTCYVTGSGSGASVEGIIHLNGVIPELVGFEVKAPGEGYTVGDTFVVLKNSSGEDVYKFPCDVVGRPEITITDPSGSGAELEAMVNDGVITGVRILSHGQGYTEPVLTVQSNAGGSGAILKATTVSDGDYPRAVGYFEQRRIFAGLTTDPQRVLMTKSGTESDMSYSLPYRDDDRISFQIASREFNAIQHVVSLSNLLLLTVGMSFRISPQDGSVITPDSITAKPQSNEGASRVMPQIINNSAIYCAARGGHVREIAYQYAAGGYVSNDLCLRATHLFDFKTIKDSALSRAPIPIVWFVSSDGSLLAQTYIPEQEVNAWSQLVTDGVFESVASVEEGDEDHLYVVVRREVNGQTRRYVERMASQAAPEIQNSFFVDSGAVYEGDPATMISGLDWLEGKTVSILADGAVMPHQIVTDGKVVLDHPASKVVVGLPYMSDAQTLPVLMQDTSLGSGRMKNVTQIYLRVYKSSGIFAGPSFEERDLAEYKQRTTESPGSPPALYTGELELRLFPAWQDSGTICVRQRDPLPLTIQSAVLTVST